MARCSRLRGIPKNRGARAVHSICTEKSLLARLKRWSFSLSRTRGSQIDISSRYQAFDDFVDLECISGSPRESNHRRPASSTALKHSSASIFFRIWANIEFCRIPRSQVAAKQRLQHQHKGIGLRQASCFVSCTYVATVQACEIGTGI